MSQGMRTDFERLKSSFSTFLTSPWHDRSFPSNLTRWKRVETKPGTISLPTSTCTSSKLRVEPIVSLSRHIRHHSLKFDEFLYLKVKSCVFLTPPKDSQGDSWMMIIWHILFCFQQSGVYIWQCIGKMPCRKDWQWIQHFPSHWRNWRSLDMVIGHFLLMVKSQDPTNDYCGHLTLLWHEFFFRIVLGEKCIHLKNIHCVNEASLVQW